MTRRRGNARKRVQAFRPSSVHQFSEPKEPLAPSARGWFTFLLPLVLRNRPIAKRAETVEYPGKIRWATVVDKKTGNPKRDPKTGRVIKKRESYTQHVQHPAVLGKSTFQNRIDEKGNLV